MTLADSGTVTKAIAKTQCAPDAAVA